MKASLKLTLAMCIFGTIGIFRRFIPLSSSMVAMLRGFIGMLFLLLLLRFKREKLDRAAIRRNFGLLFVSGAAMGVNWILLFEAYNYTSVATATVCYYLAPIFIILLSPLMLKERITMRKLACVCVALAGIVLVSGVIGTGISGVAELRGVLLGLGAAVLYACVVLLNKRLGGVSAYDRTVVQLGAAAAALLPYVLLTGSAGGMARFTPVNVCMLLLVCVVHTGVAYALYFGSLMELNAQTAAILSYIDPVVAILLSALLLGEQMDVLSCVGAVMVLGAAVASEL